MRLDSGFFLWAVKGRAGQGVVFMKIASFVYILISAKVQKESADCIQD